MKVISWLIAKLEKLNVWIIDVGVICLFFMMVIDTVNIIGIKFGLEVVPAGKTFIEELMSVLVYIGMAYVLLGRGHIKTEILKNRFPRPLRFASDVLTYAVIASVGGFIFWRTIIAAIDSFQRHATVPAKILVPIGPFILIIALAFFNLALCALLVLIRECLSRSAGQEEGEKDPS